jgi:hypothetical protein
MQYWCAILKTLQYWCAMLKNDSILGGVTLFSLESCTPFFNYSARQGRNGISHSVSRGGRGSGAVTKCVVTKIDAKWQIVGARNKWCNIDDTFGKNDVISMRDIKKLCEYWSAMLKNDAYWCAILKNDAILMRDIKKRCNIDVRC